MNLKKSILAAFSLHMLAWLAVLVVFAGIVFLALGCYWLLTFALSPGAAALIVGAGLLILVAVIILAGVLTVSRARRKRLAEKHDARQRHQSDQRFEDKFSAAIGEQATEWTKEHTGTAVIGALSIGILLAASPTTRRLVCDAARPLITRQAARFMRGMTGDSDSRD